MRILFFMRHQGYVKNFESTLEELATRGHAVHLAFDYLAEPPAGRPTMEALCSLVNRYPNLTFGLTPATPVDAREDSAAECVPRSTGCTTCGRAWPGPRRREPGSRRGLRG